MPTQTKQRSPFSEATPLDMTQPGTQERAWRLIQAFKSVWSRVSHTSEELQEMIELLDRERVWDQWPQGKPYGSLDALARHEIGRSIAELDTHIVAKRARERARMAAEETTGETLPQGKVNQHNVVAQIVQPQSDRANKSGVHRNTQSKLDRLARLEDRTLYQEVRAGRMSVNRAAIEAGFVKPTATIRTDDINHAAEVLARHFDIDDIKRITDLAVHIREGQ